MPKFTPYFTALLLAAFLSPITTFAQNKPFYCAYDGQPLKANICNSVNYTGNAEAESIIESILTRIGLKKNFIVAECPDIDNAIALNLPGNNGLERIIVYSKQFMSLFNQKSGSDWAAVSILAHEIGHHLNGHTLNSDDALSYQNELAADEFSGFVLYQLGASLDQAQAAMRALPSPYGTATHPPQQSRLAAIATGWENAQAQAKATKNSQDAEAIKWFNKAYGESDYFKQIEYYTQAILLKPNYAGAFNNRALAKWNLNMYPEALRDFDEAINIKPDASRLINRARLKSYSLKQYESALADLEAALKLEPKNIEIYESKAFILEKQEKMSLAVECYDKMLQIYPNDLDILNKRARALPRLEKYREAEKDYSRMIELAPDNYNIKRMFFFLRYSDGGRYSCANDAKRVIELFNKYGHKNDHNGFDHLSLGGDAFTLSLRPDTKIIDLADFYLGYCSMLIGDYENSIKYSTKALAIDPNNMDAPFVKALCFFHQNKYQEAINELNVGIQNGKKMLEEGSIPVEGLYTEMVRKYFIISGICNAILGNFQEAYNIFETHWGKPGTERFPTGFTYFENYYFPFYARAFTYENLKYSDKAAENYESILNYLSAESTVYEDVVLKTGWNYLLSNQPNKALSILQKGAESASNNSLLLKLNLAHAYLLSGQLEQAKALYQTHKGSIVEEIDGKTWEQSVAYGFDLLTKAGITSPHFATIRKLLGI